MPMVRAGLLAAALGAATLLVPAHAVAGPVVQAAAQPQEGEPVASDAPAEATPAEAVVRTRGASLHYTGPITSEAVARARAVLEASPQVREVVVNSGGGDVEAGMDLGDMIHARGLDVRVSGGLCMSSCANYVFTAGRRKTIEPGSLVIWHGSMLQEGMFEKFDASTLVHPEGRPLTRRERRRAEREVRRDFERVLRRQHGFYAKLGVDAAITVVGQRRGCACQWTLPVADMAAFGVRDVSAPDDYGLAGYATADFPWELLRLEDSPPRAAQ